MKRLFEVLGALAGLAFFALPMSLVALPILLDAAVPTSLQRTSGAGGTTRTYELTANGWLVTTFRSRVIAIVDAFLGVFRDDVLDDNSGHSV